jgi:hypothetical protein
MKVDTVGIVSDGCLGIPLPHIEAIQHTAETLNLVIGIRPVNPFALPFIKMGYPTKPFAVKNKSTKIGIAAGLVVVNPEYSQIPKSEYKEYGDSLNEALQKDSDLQFIPCILSEAHIRGLKIRLGDELIIHSIENQTSLSISWKNAERIVRVIAKKDEQTNEYMIVDTNDKPILVLGKSVVNNYNNKSIKPITSDYDLLVICPTYNDLNLNGKDKTPLPIGASVEYIQSLVKASKSPDYTGPREDAKGGNWSERTKETITAINENIAKVDVNRRGKNLEMVHHNTELHNPFATDLAKNLPCLIVLPYKMNIFQTNATQIMMVETKAELHKLRELISKQKYYWPMRSNLPVQNTTHMTSL